MKVYIITGTTRGIGEAMAQRWIHEGNQIFCLSRTKNPRLQVQARMRNCELREFELDLSSTSGVREAMKDIFREIDASKVELIYLVNNAGSVKPVRSIGREDASELIRGNIGLNLIAPVVISDSFIRATSKWPIDKRILSISTGAARRPIHGWSAYCVSKAGLEMFTRCINEEQMNNPHPVRAVSIAPGMVNTEMQSEIRSSSKTDFPEVDRYINAKEKGELLDPLIVAGKLDSFLHSTEFGKDMLLHINQL